MTCLLGQTSTVAIAIGHPLGASGARIMTTLVNALEQRGGRYGLQTMCEGGGMANATIIERLMRTKHAKRKPGLSERRIYNTGFRLGAIPSKRACSHSIRSTH